MERKRNNWRRCVLSVCLFSAMMAEFSCPSQATEVPLSFHYPGSNKDWWLYQFSNYDEDPLHDPFSNTNCGPASTAMVINYFTGRGLSTSYGTFQYGNIPNVHCSTRGYYCSEYLKAEGYPSGTYNKGYYSDDWSVPGARDYQIQNALALEGLQSHIIEGADYANAETYLQEIENGIKRGQLSIVCVNPTHYIDTTITSHWTVVYGYDDNYVYLNDPGWYYFSDHHRISKTNFLAALWTVNPSSWRRTIAIDFSFQTMYVPDDYPTIQNAITDSVDGTTIIVRDGTYTGQGNRNIDFMGKAIVLRSENGPENCIIDCQASEADPHRAFDFHNREDANAILDGFTITNSNEAFGGAIRCSSYSSPTIQNCHIINNMAAHGGGIYCSSNPVIKNCLIENNIAGGLWGSGGGICASTSPQIENCIIRNNMAIDEGGGLAFSGTNPSVCNCQIINNSAKYGGGIYSSARNLIVENCQTTGNKANSGGGFYVYTTSANIKIDNCTISGNWAISEQYDTDGGGGIYCAGASAKITNSILWNNIAIRGTEAFLSSLDTEMTLLYSNISNNPDSIYVRNGTINWDLGNLNTDPHFTGPGYWDSNSTPDDTTDDYWIEGDYHLKSQAGRWIPSSDSWIMDDISSRCIDAGNPGYSLNDEPVSATNKRINLGYYGGTTEASKTPDNWSLTSDITNDGMVQHEDMFHQVTGWLFTEDNQNGDLNRDGVIDFVDFVYLATEWMSQTSWYGN